jgi:hypothetical protein
MNYSPKKLAISLAALVALSGQLLALDYYFTPNGTGNKTSGDSWANARPGYMIKHTANAMPDGSTLHVGSGTYGNDIHFDVTNSGTATLRNTLIGVDTGGGLPHFVGNVVNGNRSETVLAFLPGVGYWTVKDIRITDRQHGITVGIIPEGKEIDYAAYVGPCNDMVFDNLVIREVSESAISFVDADNLLVQNCRAARYRKQGFYVIHSSNTVTFKNNVADCSDTGLVNDVPYRSLVSGPVGFNFHYKDATTPYNTDILLEDCEALNNDEDGADYDQGDGFKTEARNERVTLRRCRSYRNQDANYDLKGIEQEVNDCFASGGRSGFKIWKDVTFNNCIAMGSQAQWTIASTAANTFTANYCTFHNTASTQFGAKMEGTNSQAIVNFNNCLITSAGNHTNYYYSEGGTWNLNGTTSTHKNTSTTTNSPRYNNPVYPWYGVGTEYDNNTFGLTRGYNSAGHTVGGTISVSVSDATNALAATEEVGFIPSLNWTSSTSSNQTLTNLVDHAGTATTADVVFSGTTYGYNNNTAVLNAPLTDDAKMMRSQRAGSNASTIQATVTQVPYTGYDVYVYWGGRTASETVPATMTLEMQLYSGGAYTTSATGYIKDTNRTWDGTYDESTATTAAAAVDGQEYVVFRNVNAAQFRLKSTMGNRTGFSGFQIVEH